jgi:hypothetical protein
MNLNDIYTSIRSFWQSVAPLIYAHVVFLLALRYIAGVKLDLRARLNQWTTTAEYQSGKNLLTEFELWKKLPWLLIVGSLIYLTLLRDGLSIMQHAGVPPLRVAYSEEQFWIEAKPINLIEDVLRFAPRDRARYWQVLMQKEQLLDEYKAKAPDRYQRNVGWHESEFGKRLGALEIGVGFLLATVLVVVWYWRERRKAGAKHPVSWLRTTVLLTLVALYCAYERISAEQATEYRLHAELMFVGNELQFDKSRAESRMSETEFEDARRALAGQLLEMDVRERLNLPWLSRLVERFNWRGEPLLDRKFPYLSKAEFRRKFSYLFPGPPPPLQSDDGP